MRTMVLELGSLEWLFAMIQASPAASHALQGESSFESSLLEMEDFFSEQLRHIQVLLEDLYARQLQAAENDTGSSEAQRLRQSIRERDSDNLKMSTPTGEKSKGVTRRLSFLLQSMGSRTKSFQHLVDKIRQSAADTARGDTPLSDAQSQAELLLGALHTCSSAVSKIETALAQYG